MLEHRFTVISPAYSVWSLKPCEECVLENTSRLRQACGAKRQLNVWSLPYLYILRILQFTTGSLLCVLQPCVLLQHKNYASTGTRTLDLSILKKQNVRTQMYKSIHQVRVLQILYKMTVCTFVILWKIPNFKCWCTWIKKITFWPQGTRTNNL